MSIRLPVLVCAVLAHLLLLSAAGAQEDAPVRTVITSDLLEMQGAEDENFFYFRKNVHVLGTNLELRCDEMTVVSARNAEEGAAVGEIGAIKSIVAVGNVVIHQAGRSAYAGRAEVDPAAGTVTLSEKPRVVDGEVEVEGYQFVLYKDEKKFRSIPDPNAPEGKPVRSVVRLGELPDLGFDQPKEEITVTEQLGNGGDPKKAAPEEAAKPVEKKEEAVPEVDVIIQYPGEAGSGEDAPDASSNTTDSEGPKNNG